MVEQWIVLGHLVFTRGFQVSKATINIILSLPYPGSVQEVLSFLGHASFY